MPAHPPITAEIIQPTAAGAGRRLPVQVVLRAEAHFRVRSTPAEPGSSSGLSPPLRRTVHLLQLPPVSLSPFSCLRVVLRPYDSDPAHLGLPSGCQKLC